MEVDANLAEQIAAGADPTDEQFRLLVQSVTDYAIFLLDSGGRVISWNDGAERIEGYSAGEIVGRPIALFYPPEDRDAGKPEQGLRCAEREGCFRTEGWRVRKDGSRFWADVAITALRDAHGGLRGFAKVTRDMTARHRERENEQRVAAMLERHRGLAELSLLALGETGVEPVLERAVALTRDLLQTEFVRILELLPAGDAFKLVAGTGWKPGMVGSATVPLRANSILSYTLYSSELVPDAANQPRRAAVIEDLASEDRFPRSGMLHEHGVVSGMSGMIPGRRTPYGVLRAHSAARRRLVPGDAEFLQAVANVVSAAGQRQRAHEQVQASEARLVAFADHSPAVMFVKDREGRYRLVNEQFLQRFGLRRDQVIGRTDLELFPRDQALRFAANDAEVLSRGAPLQFEESARYVEGDRVSVVAKFPLPDASGAVIGVGGVATDITEQRNSEAALRAAADNLQALTRRLVEAEEARRRRIARALRDGKDAAAGLRPEAAVALFRIAQEALNNVAKHAGARQVRIELAGDAEEIVMRVVDDGAGFDPAAAARGKRWGMKTMRERAEAAGGRLEVDSAPGAGTVVRASVRR